MRSLWSTIVLLAWALWFGGLIALFIFVTTLFKQDHALAAQAAPKLFHAFEIYQLILAAAAVVSGALWRMNKGPALVILVLVLFILCSAGAAVSPLFITPRINRLQRLGQTHTEEFGKLHGEAMLIYTADSVLLLIAGLMLPKAIKRG
jgi:glucan phosphoethanolaminetransferase (alkaline phosphatase superfamily)